MLPAFMQSHGADRTTASLRTQILHLPSFHKYKTVAKQAKLQPPQTIFRPKALAK